MLDEATVIEAIRSVRDPELDESIVELDFVASVVTHGDAVSVRLRLPTYFCAPNFSYMMVDDVRQAVLGLAGVGHAEVVLDDHFASQEITDGVNQERGFARSFPGLADDELGDLRLLFRRKSLMSRQYHVSRRLRAAGLDPAEMAGLALGQLPADDDAEEYRRARRELDIAVDDDAPFLVNGAGQAISAQEAEAHLARARSIAFAIELNAEFCSGVLATRYPDARPSRRKAPV